MQHQQITEIKINSNKNTTICKFKILVFCIALGSTKWKQKEIYNNLKNNDEIKMKKKLLDKQFLSVFN